MTRDVGTREYTEKTWDELLCGGERKRGCLHVGFANFVRLGESEVGQENVQECLHLDHRKAHADAGLKGRGSR